MKGNVKRLKAFWNSSANETGYNRLGDGTVIARLREHGKQRGASPRAKITMSFSQRT